MVHEHHILLKRESRPDASQILRAARSLNDAFSDDWITHANTVISHQDVLSELIFSEKYHSGLYVVGSILESAATRIGENSNDIEAIKLAYMGFSVVINNLQRLGSILASQETSQEDRSLVMGIGLKAIELGRRGFILKSEKQQNVMADFVLDRTVDYIERSEGQGVSLITIIDGVLRYAPETKILSLFRTLSNNEATRLQSNYCISALVQRFNPYALLGRELMEILLRSYGIQPDELISFWKESLHPDIQAARTSLNLMTIMFVEELPSGSRGAIRDLILEGVMNPGRYTSEQLVAQAARLTAKVKHPRTFFRVSPQADWNGSFNLLDTTPMDDDAKRLLKEAGYVVHVTDSDSSIQLDQRVERFIENHGEQERVIIFLGGHGTSDSINLGQGAFGSLQVADFRIGGIGAKTIARLGPHVSVILDSCSTGKQIDGENIAQVISLLPNVDFVTAPDRVSALRRIENMPREEDLGRRVIYLDTQTHEEFDGTVYINGQKAA